MPKSSSEPPAIGVVQRRNTNACGVILQGWGLRRGYEILRATHKFKTFLPPTNLLIEQIFFLHAGTKKRGGHQSWQTPHFPLPLHQSTIIALSQQISRPESHSWRHNWMKAVCLCPSLSNLSAKCHSNAHLQTPKSGPQSGPNSSPSLSHPTSQPGT